MSKRIPEHTIKELARAKKALLAAKTLMGKRLFEDCVSRAYYAVLHAAKAALFLGGVEADTHRQCAELTPERDVEKICDRDNVCKVLTGEE